MNLASKLLIILAVLGTSACSTIKTKELTSADAANLAQKTFVYSKYRALPDFPAQTGANVQFGLLGVATAIANGNAMVKKNNIADPAIAISQRLAQQLEQNHNLKLVQGDSTLITSNKIPELLKAYGKYDYVLDVRSLGWGSIYYVSDWNNYRVMYTAHARLIDTKNKTIVAEEVCSAMPEYTDTNEAPSYDDLEKGVGLKKELTRAVDFCVDHITQMAKFHRHQPAEAVTTAQAVSQ